jgi:very-short-patch-repair endonuclease
MTAAQDRRRRVIAAAEPFGGVLSRPMLRAVGADSHVVRREADAGRWAVHGRRTVTTHTRPLGTIARRWHAVWEVGCGATLDGVTALQAAGMRGFDSDVVHVSVSHAARPTAVAEVHIHRVNRVDGETMWARTPRARPEVAALRAAHWASSDRQAALLLVLPMQQRLLSAPSLVDATHRVAGRTRRKLVAQLVHDIADGAQSLGELDFAAACRRRGLPSPDRQVVTQGPSGRIYLDVRWSAIGLVVEIDGAGHSWGLAPAGDALRQNAVTLDGDLVLRVDLVGWRLHADDYLDQVCRAHALLTARLAV